MQHITNQITANVLKNLNNMKKLLVIAAMFVGTTAFAQDIYIPNAFTPDGDMRNDYWKPIFDDTLKFNDYDLTVWTRSGELVFETKDPFQYWDGSYWNSSTDSPITFVYQLYIHIPNLTPMRKRGFVTLVR